MFPSRLLLTKQNSHEGTRIMITRNLFQKIGMLTVIGLAATSCSQDELTGNRGLNGNAVKFSIVASSTPAEDTPETRALNADDTPVMLLAPGGQDTLYLHPWVTENCAAPSAPQKKGTTRGVPVEDEHEFESVCENFGVTAYTQDGKPFMQDEKISKVSNGVWSPDETYFWPAEASLDFYAHAPYGNTTMTITNNKEITFNYTVPNQATEQPDIMFAHVTASKETFPGSTVSLTFRHALAGVKFVAKDVTNCTIKSITLQNLYAEGSCTYSTETETFAWTPSGDKKDFSQAFDVTLKEQENGAQPITDKKPETTFMLIPQSLDGVTVEVALETTSGESFTLTGSLAQTGTWEAGKIYTYAISTESINWVYEFEVTPTIKLPLGETQAQYTVTSYRYRKGNRNVKEAVAWSADYQKGTETNMLDNNLKDITEEYTPVFTSTGQGGNQPSSYDFVVEGATLHTDYDNDEQKLKGNTPKGTADAPYNLATDNGSDGAMTTANCYVVNAAGIYKLPLVYGNALKDGRYNESAVNDDFRDYQNNKIAQEWINDAYDATLVWSDGFYMFKDIKLSDDKKYLIFTIDSKYLQQANAVLAARDENGVIMWSWHIWVTEHDVLDDTYTVHGYGNDNSTYGLMKWNLGWVDNKQVYYNQREFEIKFTQERSGNTEDLTVTQEGTVFDYKDVGSTYYQWGRKDPLVALKNWNLIGTKDYRPHQVGKADYTYRTEAKRVSIGESIQHPNVYYVRNGTIGNWNSNPVGTLWNNQSNGGTIDDVSSTKTIYDPSPRGFKVPVPKAFAVFVNGCSESPGGTKPNVGTLNGTSNVGVHKNQYEVYTQSKSGGEMITLTGTGQRADLDKKLPAYTEGNTDAELGGLWAMYGVYFMTCVPVKNNDAQAYTLVIRRDVDAPDKCTVYTYGFIGNMTMARPVRPVKETN